MPNIIPFNFNNTDVRVIERSGEPWFVAKDVATILGYANTKDAVSRHCKAAISGGVAIHDPMGREQNMTIIPERDLYRLVMRSKLPAAEQFEEWVVAEVLPAIRKTGGYSAGTTMLDFTDPAAAARAWLQEHETRVYYENVVVQSTMQPGAIGVYIEMLKEGRDEVNALERELRDAKESGRMKFHRYMSRFTPFTDAAQGLGAEAIGALALLTNMIHMKKGKMQRDDRFLAGYLRLSVRKTKSLTDFLISAGRIQTKDGKTLTTNVAPIFMTTRSKSTLMEAGE